MKKQFGFMTNHYKEHKNIFLNIFLFIVGFLVGVVCGANLYVTALKNEPKYFAQTTVKKGVNEVNKFLGTKYEISYKKTLF